MEAPQTSDPLVEEIVVTQVPDEIWQEVVEFYIAVLQQQPVYSEPGTQPRTATFNLSGNRLQLVAEDETTQSVDGKASNSVFLQVHSAEAVTTVYNQLPKNAHSKQPPQSIVIMPGPGNHKVIAYTLASACYKYKNYQFAQNELRMGVIHNPPY